MKGVVLTGHKTMEFFNGALIVIGIVILLSLIIFWFVIKRSSQVDQWPSMHPDQEDEWYGSHERDF